MPPHAAEPDADHCSAAAAQLPRTDPTRWRLNVASGRQTWHYHTESSPVNEEEVAAAAMEGEEEVWPQTDAERYALGLPVLSAKSSPGRCTRPGEAVERGFQFFKLLQTQDGHWAGEYGGPMFLIPGLVIAHYICDVQFEEPQRLELIRYLANRASPIDGGWGIHIEGVSTVFGTALNYVALRLLGIPRDHPIAVRARRCLISLGGAIGIPSWGKLWLALLGLYDWEGMNPITPELWLLPHFLPFHPGRYWVHTRAVYMPMSYLYGRKYTKPLDDLTNQLREELYILPYDNIYWPSARNHIARRDLYVPHSTLLNIANVFLGFYESIAPEWLRKRALDEVYQQITMEDENTFYLDLGPVNKTMNMICVWLTKGPSSPEFRAHLPRISDFLWMGKEGMMMNGTNGSQLWDTSFAMQAMVECGIADLEEHQSCVRSAHRFLEDMQIKRNVPNMTRCYRHPSLGAWPFSTRDQGYTVSDCTAEGLKAVLAIQSLPSSENLVPYERLCQAVDILLGMQNSNGGFASYELIRAPHFLELINPAEVFGDIMTEYSYPECTTASLLGLMAFSKRYPDYRAKDIQRVKIMAIRYILRTQREDGSWFGSWAICFTYATMFALDSLASVGKYYHTNEASRRGCEFLLAHQREDGGWGESYRSCESGSYVQHEDSQVVQTSWALLALMAAKCPDTHALQRGVQLLMSRQMPNGEWLQEGIEGVFNRNCMISYPNYKFIFCLWALGRYRRIYGDEVIKTE